MCGRKKYNSRNVNEAYGNIIFNSSATLRLGGTTPMVGQRSKRYNCSSKADGTTALLRADGKTVLLRHTV